jgi:hypothetical protein
VLVYFLMSLGIRVICNEEEGRKEEESKLIVKVRGPGVYGVPLSVAKRTGGEYRLIQRLALQRHCL